MKLTASKSYFIISFKENGELHYYFSPRIHVFTFETAKRFPSFKAALDCIYKQGLGAFEPKVIEVKEWVL